MWRTEPHYTVENLGHIQAPTLIIAGEFEVVRPEHTAQYAKAIPGAEAVIVAGGSHAVPTEKPAIVNDLILRFLAEPRR